MTVHPHPKNACGGGFQDWLEILLTKDCNAHCAWCIERAGYHPKVHADVTDLAAAAIASGQKNIILLGGEPTLYKQLDIFIYTLWRFGRNVWLTTNGSRLRKMFVSRVLNKTTGVNVSIHHYDLSRNAEITGICLDRGDLSEAFAELHAHGSIVRLNCNAIRSHVDSETHIMAYIDFAKELGADSVRFAELKLDEDNFVDLHAVLSGQYGLNTDPFTLGCAQDVEIRGLRVNFRQMCGFQTKHRKAHVNPAQCTHKILYYDGKLYDGWQSPGNMDVTARRQLLDGIADGSVSVMDAVALMMPVRSARGASLEDSSND